MGEPETTDCPAGGTAIETAEECGAAAKKLGKMFLGEQNPAEMDPKGASGCDMLLRLAVRQDVNFGYPIRTSTSTRTP